MGAAGHARGRRRSATRAWRRRSSGWSARRADGRRGRRRTSSCSATAAVGPGPRADPVAARRRRRPPRAGAARAAHRAARWSSTPASRARSTTSPAWSATAPTPSHPVAGAGDEIVARARGKGLLKVMSKMGVSTVSAYRGAQVFEAIGLGPELIERHFVGTPSKLGGLGLRGLAREVLDAPRAHVPAGRRAVPLAARRRAPRLEPGHGRRAAARRVAALRRGRRTRAARATAPLRGQLAFRDARPDRRSRTSSRPTEIMKRFATGAMSLGSISPEAHESLALAMNEIGGRSNTGEGGEDPGALHRRRGAPRSSRSPPRASA